MGLATALLVAAGTMGLVGFLAYVARLGRTATPVEKERKQIEDELVQVRHLLREAGVPESQHPGSTPQKIVRMHVEGRVAISGDVDADEPLPPWEHGEMPKAAWAGNGHLFVVGYRYTGAAGEDTGTIWHRHPDGRWTVDLERPERPLVGITGHGGHVWVVGGDELWAYDGQTWTMTPMPPSCGTSLVARLPDGSLVTTTYDGLIRRFDGQWHEERPLGGRPLYALGGDGDRLFAGGDGGILVARTPDGKWTDEAGPGSGQVRAIATGREGTFAAAGPEVWQRFEAGWAAVDAPRWARSFSVLPDGSVRLVADGIYRLEGDEWVRDGDAAPGIVVFDGARRYAVYERHEERS